MRRRTWGIIFSLSLLVTACGGDQGQETEGLTIVVTTNILGDVVANLVGEDATVEILMPLGVDPHEFQPSSAQVARINTADLVVANGLALEEGMIDVLAAAVSDGARVLEIAPLVSPLPFSGEHGHEHADDEHADDLDPHIWMDPLRMAQAARLIASELASLRPEVDWNARAEAYAARLVEADTEIAALLATVPSGQRRLITNHATFGYFADRYGWEVLRTIIPGGSSVGAPSSADLADLVHLIEEEEVTAIFVETTQPDALAQAVAAEVGKEVVVVELHTESLTPQGTEADTLIGLLQTNARLITDALTRDG